MGYKDIQGEAVKVQRPFHGEFQDTWCLGSGVGGVSQNGLWSPNGNYRTSELHDPYWHAISIMSTNPKRP